MILLSNKFKENKILVDLVNAFNNGKEEEVIEIVKRSEFQPFINERFAGIKETDSYFDEEGDLIEIFYNRLVYFAVILKKNELLKELIKLGADLVYRPSSNYLGNDDLILEAIRSRFFLNNILSSIDRDNYKALPILKDAGLNINVTDESGYSALAVALKENIPNSALELINLGADLKWEKNCENLVSLVSIKTRGILSKTTPHLNACRAVLIKLIEKGVDINKTDNENYSIFSNSLCLIYPQRYSIGLDNHDDKFCKALILIAYGCDILSNRKDFTELRNRLTRVREYDIFPYIDRLESFKTALDDYAKCYIEISIAHNELSYLSRLYSIREDIAEKEITNLFPDFKDHFYPETIIQVKDILIRRHIKELAVNHYQDIDITNDLTTDQMLESLKESETKLHSDLRKSEIKKYIRDKVSNSFVDNLTEERQINDPSISRI